MLLPIFYHRIRNLHTNLAVNYYVKMISKFTEVYNLRIGGITLENKCLTNFSYFVVTNISSFFKILNLFDDLIEFFNLLRLPFDQRFLDYCSYFEYFSVINFLVILSKVGLKFIFCSLRHILEDTDLPSNSGKTWLPHQLLLNRILFFERGLFGGALDFL